MISTSHTAQRFVKRVIGKMEYTYKDLQLAKAYLTGTLENVIPNSPF